MIVKFFNGKYYSTSILHMIVYEIFFYNFFLKKKICISILFIGNNFSSNLYVKNKINAGFIINISILLLKFSKSVKLITLLKIICTLNHDFNINSILIQVPLIHKLNKLVLFNSINFLKDIDLLNTFNFGKYVSDYSNFLIPSTAAAIIFVLKIFKINMHGLKSVVFGFSNIVGKPIVCELIKVGSTVSIINKIDNDFSTLIKNSDLIISAIGKPHFFSFNCIVHGSIIIDIGINECNYSGMSGDFNMNLSDTVNLVTPVPGGVGPLTVVNLLFNVVKIYVNKNFKIMI